MQKVVLAALILFTAGASAAPIEVPMSIRQPNNRYGSCADAALVMQLREAGRSEEANEWWTSHSGGVDASQLDAMMDAAEIEYDQTTVGDMHFIEAANEAGHLVEVEVEATNDGSITHALLINDITPQFVTFIDCNHINRDWRMSRKDFSQVWTGWAFYIR